MKFEVEEKFFEQARLYSLRHTCEHCAYFDERTGRCLHEYPNKVHRRRYYEASPEWIIPCKDFELA